MPIYSYRCESCGFAQDILQKMSDAPRTECPSCKAAAFRKQVTAAGFQLKGSGWYATDFRNNGAAPKAAPAAASATEATPSTATSAEPASTSTATPASAACSTGCGCH